MKMITAVIKPFKLDDVLEALTEEGINGLTATEVKGYGHQKGQIDPEREAQHGINFLPKVKLEIAVDDKVVDKIVETIQKSGETGTVGDGKIFVSELERVVRIRTGEENSKAL